MSARVQRWAWLILGFVLGLWTFGARADEIKLESVTVVWAEQVCITACGLASWDVKCSELQEVENRALRAYAKHVKRWTTPAMCAALKGWDVRVHAFYSPVDLSTCGQGGWILFRTEKGEAWCAGGYTHTESRSLEIGVGDLLTGSLMHELGHVLDIGLNRQVGHCGWIKRGLRRAITEVTKRIEVSAEAVERVECFPVGLDDGGVAPTKPAQR